MRQYDDRFLALFDELEIEAPDASKAEIDQHFDRVSKRVGFGLRRWSRSAKAIAAAAVIAITSLGAAATYYNVSDAFRSVLKERNDAGELAPVSTIAPMVDRAGMLMEDSVFLGGVEVSLRAVVSDESELLLLVDIEDVSGNPLCLEQPDGSLSLEDLQFGSAVIEMIDHPEGREGRVDATGYRWGNIGYSYDHKIMDSDPADNRSTILFTISVDGDTNLVSNRFRLTLVDLLQYGEKEGISTGMPPDTLYELTTRFSGHTAEDFEVAGWSRIHETDTTIYYHRLLTDGGQLLDLPGNLEGFQVDNAVVWDSVYYLRGKAPEGTNTYKAFNAAALISEETGDIIPLDNREQWIDENGKVCWLLSFRDIEKPEDLKGYVLTINQGHGLYPLVEGEWEFEFTLDYESMTRSQAMSREFTLNGFDFIATRTAVSPFALYFDMETDPETYLLIYPPVEDTIEYRKETASKPDPIDHKAIVTMLDGSVLEVSRSSGESVSDEGGKSIFRSSYRFDAVIDPANVASVTIGNLEIPFDKPEPLILVP